MPTPDRREDSWQAGEYDRSFSFVSNLARDLIDLLGPQPGERILDLGCGSGTLTSQIAESGAAVLGIDRDEEMIAQARRTYPGLRFEVADAYEFRVEERQDAVFSNAALHWMTQPERVLERVAAALRPGGRFVAEMGGKGNVAGLHDSMFEALAVEGVPPDRLPHPWYFPSPAEYASLLEAHGFEVTDLRYFDRPTRLEGGDGGLRAWYRMFAPMLLAHVPEGCEDAVLARAEDALRPSLYHDGAWWADYRRLRFRAVRRAEAGQHVPRP